MIVSPGPAGPQRPEDGPAGGDDPAGADETAAVVEHPLNRRSPFFIGMAAAAGVAVTALGVALIITARDTLVLIGLALFLAVGLEPVVSGLARRGLPRWVGVLGVVLALLGTIGGFLAVAIPELVTQGTAFAVQVPAYVDELQNQHTTLGGLNQRFHVTDSIAGALGGLVNGVLGAGVLVLGALADTLIVIVLTVYVLADLPRLRAGMYRLVPKSRRPRAELLGDQVFAKIGAYVLGVGVLAVIAGSSALTWMLIVGVPFSLLLAVMVALLDLIPVVGSSTAGVVVTLVALTTSTPVGLATAGFFVVYRLVEDYVLTPRIIGRALHVPALLTIVALLLGAALLGIVGAIVAIPIAAAIQLIGAQLLVPRLDAT